MTILHRLVLLRVMGKPMYYLILAFSLFVFNPVGELLLLQPSQV